MKKVFIFLMIIFLITIFVGITFAKENSPAAVILKAKGEIILHRGDINKGIKNGEVLYSGDEVVSKEQSLAAIRFVDNGAIMKLFSNSILTINTEKIADKLNKKLYLEVGDLWSKVSKKKGEYQIGTPTSVAAVKGTNFYTDVKENGETMVVTFEGIVELRTNVGSKDVAEGQTGIAKKGEMPVVENAKPGQVPAETKKEIEKGEENILEIEFKDENGETKKMKIYYK